MANIYTPDEGNTYVYAENLEQAVDVFIEEMEYEPNREDWQELGMDYVGYAVPWIGEGGYLTYTFEEIIKDLKIMTPHVFTDIEEELEWARDW